MLKMTDHDGTKNKKNGQLNKTYDAIVIGAGMSGLYQLYKLLSPVRPQRDECIMVYLRRVPEY